MDLRKIRFIDGISIVIYAGDIPVTAFGNDPQVLSTIPEDPIVVIVRHWGREIFRLAVGSIHYDDHLLELVQGAIDAAGAPRPDHPPRPLLVKDDESAEE